MTAAVDQALIELRNFRLGYPGTHLRSPWPGHKDLAVSNKTFAYLSLEGEPSRSLQAAAIERCGTAASLYINHRIWARQERLGNSPIRSRRSPADRDA